ncbi:hypothetical protein DMA12_38605 [Amycolatopsis balhimycina DSM 5908]|uniref:Resolvase/invertase-type recombinase catalytic domain-containing protein n=1 Tax=Amycolatopsis balhimycina DSM 5908 TaxID=1081091 RepID=A0A428W1C3_AMYBA|nr:hypothetical protein [Amycolatopsis balhimycina]RSM36875.1 hypothetical protein DMA12_38605 [Amycolatopsis balhimycina DSM 5908]
MTTSPLLQLPETAEPASAVQLGYGYMRVPAHVPDHKVRHLEQTVIRFAQGHGLTFAGFFFEFHCGSREAFDELVAELVRTGARHVVVPSLRHLALHAQLQVAMCTYLDEFAGAEVLALRHPGARRTEQRRLPAGAGAPA